RGQDLCPPARGALCYCICIALTRPCVSTRLLLLPSRVPGTARVLPPLCRRTYDQHTDGSHARPAAASRGRGGGAAPGRSLSLSVPQNRGPPRSVPAYDRGHRPEPWLVRRGNGAPDDRAHRDPTQWHAGARPYSLDFPVWAQRYQVLFYLYDELRPGTAGSAQSSPARPAPGRRATTAVPHVSHWRNLSLPARRRGR